MAIRHNELSEMKCLDWSIATSPCRSITTRDDQNTQKINILQFIFMNGPEIFVALSCVLSFIMRSEIISYTKLQLLLQGLITKQK